MLIDDAKGSLAALRAAIKKDSRLDCTDLVEMKVRKSVAVAACTKPDHSKEAMELSDELTDLGFKNQELALARVDSADSNLYCIARWILADGAFVNGEYGKSLALAKEILAFVGEGASAKDITMKCRALSQIAECESEHDLYIDNKMPEKALPLMAKMDTAINRLARCSNDTDWVLQKRRNNVTISKAMVYAANEQHNQAESLFQEHRQSQGLDATDKTAEGVYLSMTGRYDEAVRLFDEADSMMRSSGTPVTDIYVKTLLKHKYDALQRAGRTNPSRRSVSFSLLLSCC